MSSSSEAASNRKRRVGFVGYGFLGKSLVTMILQDKKAMELMELAFVCDLFAPNNVMNDEQLPIAARAASLDNWQAYKADLIVEVAHPSISTEWGAKFLSEADYMIASTTTFADRDTEMRLKTAANEVRARLHLQLYSQAGSAACYVHP